MPQRGEDPRGKAMHDISGNEDQEDPARIEINKTRQSDNSDNEARISAAGAERLETREAHGAYH